MQWRLGHRPPRIVKLNSSSDRDCVAEDDLDEDKDDYEEDLEADDYGEEHGETDEVADEDDESDEEGETPDCSSEKLVDTQLTLPETKPDIDRVLRVLAKTQVQHWEAVRTAHGKKLLVTGLLLVGVEYAAKVIDQSMHFSHFDVPFHAFLSCPNARNVVSSVEYLHYETIDLRSISLAVLVGVDAS